MTKQKGFALVYVMAFIAILTLTAISFASFSFNGLNLSDTGSDTYRAFYIAEAGIAKKFMDLRDGSTSNLSESFTISTGVAGSYSVTVDSVSGSSPPAYVLSSTGTFDGVSKTVSLEVKQMSYAEYSYISNSEEALYWGNRGGNAGNVWFTTRDQIHGPLMTNDQLNIYGDPEFFGSVASASSAINYYNPGEDAPIFHSTLTLDAEPIQMPMVASSISTAAQSGGVYLNYNGTTSLTINSNRTLTVANSNMPHPHIATVNYPANGAIYSTGALAINSGIVNGQLAVGSGTDIEIKGSILYDNDPIINPDSADMLAIVAASDVMIDDALPNGSNLKISGYVIAQTGGFYLENYSTTGVKGTLTLLGGVSQNARGPVGTFSSSTGNKLSGYTKSYVYDTRFEEQAPLFFPCARDQNGRYLYKKVSWSET